MKKATRFLAILLSIAMAASLLTSGAFAADGAASSGDNIWSDELFSDVPTGEWYYAAVKNVYELGLMKGMGGDIFLPKGTVRLSEVVTVAARLHSIATTGGESFRQGAVWYRVYADYALAQGILDEEPDDYSRAATRLEVARILARALPESMLTAINKVDDGMIPDVESDESVYLLYRAGVLIGSDADGTFHPDSSILRNEMAAIVARMALPELRESIELTAVEAAPAAPAPDTTTTPDPVPEEGPDEEGSAEAEYIDENNAATVPYDVANPGVMEDEGTMYSTDHILIKLRTSPSAGLAEKLAQAGIVSMEQYMEVSTGVWYRAYVEGDVQAVMENVREISAVLVAEYDFAYSAGSIIESETITEHCSGNEHWKKQWHLRSCGVQKAWEDNFTTDYLPGEGVIVAVIDTGVDYTHEDLASNIWINADEIPDNGIDDDGNGYVDDYYGVNTIVSANTKAAGNVMDDHGHGTHVAGIIAAANNNLGVVGVAYGAKIMIIKAGQASGYFLQSDLAEAILYAYENGADVINMSLGGSASSIAVQDALETAYTRCVLVASAGNDGLPNQGTEHYPASPNYPAALKYVLGVMSVDQYGVESTFTNWDVSLYNTVEYELYAPGTGIHSTLPNNSYATWSGTSMAAPMVSAMAAIWRSAYPDRETYPTKFIYGQLVSTGKTTAICNNPEMHTVNGMPHNLPTIVDISAALDEMPTPDVGMTDYTIFDSVELSPNNNGDGVVDAGETVAIGFTLTNRWGMSENTTVTLDTLSSAGISNPYVTINGASSATMDYGSIGTYSDSDCGKVYDEDGMWIGWENPFLVTISEDCPNDYIIAFNVTVSGENALDEEDDAVYTSESGFEVDVRRGILLPSIFEEDTVLTADNYYILPNSSLIPAGVTVTVEAGTQIQFWTDDPNDAYADVAIVYLLVEGSFICEGTEDARVRIFPSELCNRFEVRIYQQGSGTVKLSYTDVVNPNLNISYADHCEFTQTYRASRLIYRALSNGNVSSGYRDATISAAEAVDCSFYKLGSGLSTYPAKVYGHFTGCIFVDCFVRYTTYGTGWQNGVYDNCLFYGNNNYLGESTGYTSSLEMLDYFSSYVCTILTDPATGTLYICTPYAHDDFNVYQRFAEYLGGGLACINTPEELAFLKEKFANDYYYIGMVRDYSDDSVRWVDGTEVGDFISWSIEGSGSWSMFDRGTGAILVGKTAGNTGLRYLLFEIPAPYVEEITLSCYAVTMESDDEGYQIEATAHPSSIADAELIYVSEDPAVAQVDENGFVTPVAPGTTVIRVYSPDRYLYNTLDVTVIEAVVVEGVDLGEDRTVAVGSTLQLEPVLAPTGVIKGLVYTSDDTSVATVDQFGVVTAVGKGTAVITTTEPETGISDSITVTCYVAATAVEAENPIFVTSLNSAETVDIFGVSVLPADSDQTTLVWESSNPEILDVDADGSLIKGALGTATLRATLEGTDLYTEITVSLSEQDTAATVVQLQITASSYTAYAYALLSDGTLWYWGNDVRVPRKLDFENVAQFAVSGSWLMILDREGTLNVYTFSVSGNPRYAYLDNRWIYGSPVTGVVDITSGYGSAACFYLRDDGTVWGWGENGYGQLGDGTTTDRSTAIQIGVDAFITDIQAKRNGSGLAMLAEDGTVYRTAYYSSKVPTVYDVGVQALHETYFGIIFEYEETLLYDVNSKYTVDKVGTGWAGDGNIKYYIGEDGLVYKASGAAAYEVVEGVSNASQVFYIDWYNAPATYIQTADGKFYGMGYNNYYYIPNLSTGTQNTPSRIFFGFSTVDTAPVVESSNVEEGTLTGSTISLDFDQALVSGSSYSLIQLADSAGQLVGLRKSHKLDKLTIETTSALTPGETYTLTIPASALTNKFGVANEAITLTFTAAEEETAAAALSLTLPERLEALVPVDAALPASVIPDAGVTHETQIDPEAEARAAIDQSYLQTQFTQFRAEVNSRLVGCAIINRLADDDVTKWLRLQGTSVSSYTKYSVGGIYWGTLSETLINKQILDFDDYQSLADLDPGEYLTTAPENVWPFAVNAGVINADGEQVSTIGNETVTFFVEFNRDMDTSIELDVRFGSYYPYADYQVDGEWVSARRWEGTTTLTTFIENGHQFLSIDNGAAADDPALKLYKDWGRFTFEINTTEAMAMIMQGEAGDEGITLTWTQDDFDTLAGYNVYRSTSEDGYYQRLNSTVIPADVKTFFDDTVEPGTVYYYNFTVVQTDLSESAPSGKITIMSKDTMAPVMYHTPVYSAYTGSSVVITATVTDNVGIDKVTLFYRVIGETDWRQAVMTKLNDKYSAVIGANLVTTAGLEYYIEAFDGVGTANRGSADEPYVITVQETIDANSMGDVDGNGRITLLDALMLLQAVNDRLNLTEDQFARADLNGDGVLTAAEALRILQYVNGKVGSVVD